jgi:hypothetical protein
MWENILHRRYFTQDYGGQQFIEMLRTIDRDEMFFRGLVNLIQGMRCP